ncbi:GTP-dependent dephospho-CoA kinase family protein [Methanobrevibacter curvatus]|uniref:GTP-dependent dephospho-CoA kinase n=1 Tax=Methanobrevibacter curvatus TaxID=49547 RepID=A0A166BBY9_9EURY|nr:DUF359 domain-containing protein [Methanobrevibacter curvatus]KZX13129.1 hypothetical protein MBCUR_07400 [Methanobrevibacter curvatus]
MYILTKKLRHLLKSPVGELYPDFRDAIPKIKSFNFIFSVGDVTTLNLIENGLIPDLAIVDNHIQRESHDKNFTFTDNIFKIKNPPGTIKKVLWETVDKAIKLSVENDKQLIIVDGEEDLAVLPVMIMAPDNSIVLYGQPNEGLVLVDTKENKNNAKKFLKMMEKTE